MYLHIIDPPNCRNANLKLQFPLKILVSQFTWLLINISIACKEKPSELIRNIFYTQFDQRAFYEGFEDLLHRNINKFSIDRYWPTCGCIYVWRLAFVKRGRCRLISAFNEFLSLSLHDELFFLDKPENNLIFVLLIYIAATAFTINLSLTAEYSGM